MAVRTIVQQVSTVEIGVAEVLILGGNHVAKAGFSIRDAAMDHTADVPDHLRPVLDEVGRYISKHAANTESTWSQESDYGLTIRAGRDEFILAPRFAREEPETRRVCTALRN